MGDTGPLKGYVSTIYETFRAGYMHCYFTQISNLRAKIPKSFNPKDKYKKTVIEKTCMFGFLVVTRHYELRIRQNALNFFSTSLPELPIQIRQLRKKLELSENFIISWLDSLTFRLKRRCRPFKGTT